MHAPSRWLAVLLVAAACVAPSRAEDVQIDRKKLEELQRQAARAEQLERELRELRGQKSPPTPPVAPALSPAAAPVPPPPVPAPAVSRRWIPPAVEQAAAKAPPTPGLTGLKPLAAGDEAGLFDLLNHFQADPDGALRRYKGVVLRFTGVPAEVDKELLASPYTLVFRSPASTVRADVRFTPGREFTRVYAAQDRTQMVGEDGRRRYVFATVGTEMSFDAECTGFRNGVVRLTGSFRSPVDPRR